MSDKFPGIIRTAQRVVADRASQYKLCGIEVECFCKDGVMAICVSRKLFLEFLFVLVSNGGSLKVYDVIEIMEDNIIMHYKKEMC